MLSWRTKGPRAHYERTELSAYLDERSDIEGTCTFSGTAMLNGKFKGLIQSTDTLIVGEKGVVNANINGGCVLVRGEVVGNVVATERVELRGNARVFGDVEAPVVVIDEGVLFEGHCRMTKTRSEAPREARDLSVVSLKR
jgi:cytoskeletal protein CcmA (bactofilin family)